MGACSNRPCFHKPRLAREVEDGKSQKVIGKRSYDTICLSYSTLTSSSLSHVRFLHTPSLMLYRDQTWIWDLIVSVPDHCLSFYFLCTNICQVPIFPISDILFI